jgi:cysteine desulfurase
MATIYFDNNATTAPAPEVVDALLPYLRERYGNPSSLHQLGREAQTAVAAARASVARLLGASSPKQIVFTSGGSEGNQTALRAGSRLNPSRKRILTTTVEHAAVLEPLAAFEADGWNVERVGVDAEGRLAFAERIDADCALVSVMWANNETGVVNELAPIAQACRRYGALLHVDAVQACGKLALKVDDLGADFVTVSAHKLHGAKGVGALYVRRGIALAPLICGGGQEDERRGGTENVPAIVGFGRAAQLARDWLASDGSTRLATMRNELERRLVARIPDTHVHGAAAQRVANTTNLRFEGVSGEAVVNLSADEGLCASTGAACSSSRHRPSHVLMAMGLDSAQASSSVRLSLSRYSTALEVDAAVEILVGAVARLRALAGTSRS